MPPGMRLKSEGFASDLYDPASEFPLKAYCAEMQIPYADVGSPVGVETFIAYGLEFQRRYVPQLEHVQVSALCPANEGFTLTTAEGETVSARQVVVATGIADFAYVPPPFDALPNTIVTHSVQHGDVSRFQGRRVAVLGAGASALDVAVALKAAGASVDLIARRKAILFHDPPDEPRPLIRRIKAPRSGLGVGWRSRMCTDIPLAFHALPESLRHRIVERHLGPAPGWFVRDAAVGHVAMHLGAALTGARVVDDKVRITFRQQGGDDQQMEVDHVVAATGFRVALSRLGFLDQALQSRIRKADDTPVLDRHFQTSVPGLYIIGAAAANSFGPLLRFAFGAKYAARRVSRHLA